jgi:hypothetical protein
MKAAYVGFEGVIAAAIIDSSINFLPGLLRGQNSPMGALAYLPIGDRSVLATGAFNGTVMVADLGDLATQTAIRTQTPIRAAAQAAADQCLIGTDNGLISLRIPRIRRIPASQPDSDPLGHHCRRDLPGPPVPSQRAVWKGTQVRLPCLREIVSGARSGRGLAYASGHCHSGPRDHARLPERGPGRNRAGASAADPRHLRRTASRRP